MLRCQKHDLKVREGKEESNKDQDICGGTFLASIYNVLKKKWQKLDTFWPCSGSGSGSASFPILNFNNRMQDKAIWCVDFCWKAICELRVTWINSELLIGPNMLQSLLHPPQARIITNTDLCHNISFFGWYICRLLYFLIPFHVFL